MLTDALPPASLLCGGRPGRARLPPLGDIVSRSRRSRSAALRWALDSVFCVVAIFLLVILGPLVLLLFCGGRAVLGVQFFLH